MSADEQISWMQDAMKRKAHVCPVCGGVEFLTIGSIRSPGAPMLPYETEDGICQKCYWANRGTAAIDIRSALATRQEMTPEALATILVNNNFDDNPPGICNASNVEVIRVLSGAFQAFADKCQFEKDTTHIPITRHHAVFKMLADELEGEPEAGLTNCLLTDAVLLMITRLKHENDTLKLMEPYGS